MSDIAIPFLPFARPDITDAEIADLDSKDGVDAKLMQKAQTVVQQACAPKR